MLPGANNCTVQTQMMSNTGEQKRTLKAAIRHLWGLGGLRAYYRGLTVRYLTCVQQTEHLDSQFHTPRSV